jgi:hypothetical protein
MKIKDIRLADQVLTNIARGFKQAEFIGTTIFPTVSVEEESGRIATFGKEAFQLFNTKRGLNADLNKANSVGAKTISYELFENQIAIKVETKLQTEGKRFFNAQAKATNDAVRIIGLRKEQDIADVAQATSSYASGNSTTITTDFLNESDVDPLSYIMDKREIVRSKIGLYPNTCVIPAKVWRHLRNHVKIKAYFSATEAQLITIAKLQELTEIPNIVIGSAVTADDAGVFSDVWANNIILTYNAPIQEGIDRTEYDPAFGFLLQKSGHPQIYTYADESGTFQYANAVDIYEAKVVGSDAGFLIKNPIDPTVYSA